MVHPCIYDLNTNENILFKIIYNTLSIILILQREFIVSIFFFYVFGDHIDKLMIFETYVKDESWFVFSQSFIQKKVCVHFLKLVSLSSRDILIILAKSVKRQKEKKKERRARKKMTFDRDDQSNFANSINEFVYSSSI